MPARAAEEQGFGLIELLFAMVMLNIGILALVAAFQSGTMALSRSSAISNGATVADKVMETFRGIKNCAIYLNASSNGADTTSGGRTVTAGIPSATSSTTWSSEYYSYPQAYSSISPFSYSSSGQSWETNNTSATGTYTGITTCSQPTLPSGSPDPTAAVQYVQGPDNQYYPVFTYIIVTQPSGTSWTAGYVKQVTVIVLNPQKTTQVLAMETSLFDPNVGS